MARSLAFTLGNEELSVPIEKLNRDKVYGWVEKKYVDRNGAECFFGSISEDGTHIFGKEAFESGYVNEAKVWLERSDLTVVNTQGEVLAQHEASFKHAIDLKQTVSIDEFLNHVCKSVYQLDAPQSLIDTIKNSDEIFVFPFNYTASYSPDSAFLIENDNTIFMIVGQPSGFEFIAMQEAVPLLEDDDEDEEDIDFSMF